MTLSEAYASLLKYVGPVDTTTEQDFTSALNEVRERFFLSGKWKNLVTEAVVVPDAGVVTLPDDCESVLGAQLDDRPVVIFGRYHEFLPGGPGEVTPEQGGAAALIDQGDQTLKVMGAADVAAVRLTYKLKYIPLEWPAEGADDPEVLPGNLGALKLGLLSISYETNNDLERAELYFQKALALLNGEVREARGATQNTLQMSPHGWHAGRMRSLY